MVAVEWWGSNPRWNPTPKRHSNPPPLPPPCQFEHFPNPYIFIWFSQLMLNGLQYQLSRLIAPARCVQQWHYYSTCNKHHWDIYWSFLRSFFGKRKSTALNNNSCCYWLNISHNYANSTEYITSNNGLTDKSQRPRGLRRGLTSARMLGLRVRIPPSDMDVCISWVLCVVR